MKLEIDPTYDYIITSGVTSFKSGEPKIEICLSVKNFDDDEATICLNKHQALNIADHIYKTFGKAVS